MKLVAVAVRRLLAIWCACALHGVLGQCKRDPSVMDSMSSAGANTQLGGHVAKHAYGSIPPPGYPQNPPSTTLFESFDAMHFHYRNWRDSPDGVPCNDNNQTFSERHILAEPIRCLRCTNALDGICNQATELSSTEIVFVYRRTAQANYFPVMYTMYPTNCGCDKRQTDCEDCITGGVCGTAEPCADDPDCYCGTKYDGRPVCAKDELCTDLNACVNGVCQTGRTCVRDTCCAAAGKPDVCVLTCGNDCISWRQTSDCLGTGPREPENDAPCSAPIDGFASGYCECESVSVLFDCGHATLTCTDVCATGNGCISWRQTSDCLGTGPREPENDAPCSISIDGFASGYCECASVSVPFDCGHETLTCTEVCASGVNPKNDPAQTVFGTKSVESGVNPKNDPASASFDTKPVASGVNPKNDPAQTAFGKKSVASDKV